MLSQMPMFFKSLVASAIYLLFSLVEIAAIFGVFAGALIGPLLVAKNMGAQTGGNTSALSLLIGLGLALLWYLFLSRGGRKAIEIWLRAATHGAIRALGAGDAIKD